VKQSIWMWFLKWERKNWKVGRRRDFFFDVERENKELKKILRNMEMKLSVAQRDICNKDFLTRDLLRKLEEVDESSRSLMGNVDESDRMDSDVVELKDMKILENKELFQLNEELNDRLQCKNEMIYELKNTIEDLQCSSNQNNSEYKRKISHLKQKAKETKSKFEKLLLTIEETNDTISKLEEKIENINNININKEEVIALKIEELDTLHEYIESRKNDENFNSKNENFHEREAGEKNNSRQFIIIRRQFC